MRAARAKCHVAFCHDARFAAGRFRTAFLAVFFAAFLGAFAFATSRGANVAFARDAITNVAPPSSAPPTTPPTIGTRREALKMPFEPALAASRDPTARFKIGRAHV